ncbi:amidohydrolase [Pseudorhizobium halotolerans]|uniref:Amidohydrolase n=1 Tax=Pseudorhizobium halotolerans TaxID=1233081 RepID=A0ABN7JTZ5_9HYPH|nr:amidohydrolase family protein [Pseudorhizobium halotolerans]CAD7047833.1 amidohydrolase [Pseudorhizobium halotolerans]
MTIPANGPDTALPTDIDLLITGCDIVTMDPAGTTLSEAAIAVKGNAIVWMGSAAEGRKIERPASVIDGSGQIAMPGMIDAHIHTAQQLLRGKLSALRSRGPLRNPPWKNYYVPFEGLLEPEDVYLSGLVAYTNMLTVGTTCFAEAGGPHPTEMARAAIEVGIRGFVSLSTVDQNPAFAGSSVPGSMLMTTKEAYDRNIALVKSLSAQERVKGWLSLRQIIVCSPELIQSLSAAAREMGVKIHTHLAEGTYEVDYALEHYGKRPTEYLDDLGVLGRHLHCAHSIILTPEEVDLYQRHDVSACHCALGNYGVGIPRLQEMWRRNIAIGLGTDGAAAAGSLDLFAVAHAARIGQSASIGHPYHVRVPMSAEELLAVAVNGGARALGLEREIGSLETGKRADIVLIDTNNIDQFSAGDALFTAANLTVGRDVRTVIVDGRTVMKNREILSVDMDQLRFKLSRRLPQIMARFDQAIEHYGKRGPA